MSEEAAVQINTEPTTDVITPGAEPVREAGTEPIVKDETELTEPIPEATEIVYGDFKVEEGYSLGEETLGKLTAIAKEFNIPQEKAQELVDLGVEISKANKEAFEAKHAEAIEGWKAEATKDSSIGEAGIEQAKKALQRFGNEEFSNFLETSGLGNHPAMIKTFMNIAKKISEDVSTKGTQATESNRSAAQIMYGS